MGFIEFHGKWENSNGRVKKLISSLSALSLLSLEPSDKDEEGLGGASGSFASTQLSTHIQHRISTESAQNQQRFFVFCASSQENK